ncbi:MAG: cell division protein ZapB [bacterium]
MSDDKVLKLIDKMNSAVDYIEELLRENAALKAENSQIRSELNSLKNETKKMNLLSADQSQVVKAKLAGVLERLDELEQIGQ